MEAVKPTLSTVRQPIEDMAQLACELLFSRLRGSAPTTKNHVLASHLILRESCGC